MNFALDDEQSALRKSARRFLERWSSSEQVRAAMTSEAGFDEAVWGRLSGELGWTALTIPEAEGGLGLDYENLAPLMEEMGRALLCAPFLSTVALGANALIVGGSEAQRQELLPGVATGETRLTVGWMGAEPNAAADGVVAIAEPRAGGFRLSGQLGHVLDGDTAQQLIVAARAPGSAGEEGVDLFLVPAETPGLTRRQRPTMDMTRRLAELRLDGVEVGPQARLGEAGSGAETLRRVRQLACAALACEQVGVAERCLDMAVEYAKTRVQFGRAIGSFQAIKHKCADMLVKVESARAAAWYAAWAASHAPGELELAAATAKAWCSEAAFSCAAENIQIHGGIGFTWEHDAHLYFKRARAAEGLFGAPSQHRETVATALQL